MFSHRRSQPAFTAVCFPTFISLVLLAVPAMAGQGAANPAGFAGVVTDTSGAVLPGVTVTATSPALQVPSVTSVSDERGGEVLHSAHAGRTAGPARVLDERRLCAVGASR